MPRNAVPCLGFPSKCAAVRALFAEGQSHQQIAEATDLTPGDVRAILDRPLVDRPAARVPHRAKRDETKIVKGVLPRSVVVRREPSRASEEAMGRTIRAMNHPRFQLKGDDGRYLRLDADGFVDKSDYGWIGFAGQLQRLREVRPEYAGLAVVTVPPEGGLRSGAMVMSR